VFGCPGSLAVRDVVCVIGRCYGVKNIEAF
jgi:hypothetical protein